MTKINEFEKTAEEMTRPCVRRLTAYNPGPVPEARVRVMANENNLGTSELAVRAMTKAVLLANRYPDITNGKIRNKLAEKHGLNPDGIILGNGLDGVFTMLGRAFVNPGDEVIHGELTFSVYGDIAKIMDGVSVPVPMTEKYEMDIDGFIAAITPKTKIIALCNPNNPTGTLVPVEEVERLVKAAPKNVLVVIDEAYMEFACEKVTALSLIDKYPNLMVCRTFSKIFGLAGIRTGWAATNPAIVTQMYKVREPYCVNTIAEAGALAALDDDEFVETTQTLVETEKKKIAEFLEERKIEYVPSRANFIMIFTKDKTDDIYKKLFDEGILVRVMSYKGEKFIRLSIGEPDENRFVLEHLAKILDGE